MNSHTAIQIHSQVRIEAPGTYWHGKEGVVSFIYTCGVVAVIFGEDHDHQEHLFAISDLEAL